MAPFTKAALAAVVLNPRDTTLAAGRGILGCDVAAKDVRQGFLGTGQHTCQAVHNRSLGRFDGVGREVLDVGAR